MYRIGQKVTQIKPFKWRNSRYAEVTPEYGVVYTVRTISEKDGMTFLRFYEIKNPLHVYADGEMEMNFAARWFRPLIDKPTDISIFKTILNAKKLENS